MVKWWEKPKVSYKNEYNSGFYVEEAGPCPKCGSKILYNGNYFCEYWGFDYPFGRMNGPCNWYLTDTDKEVLERLGLDNELSDRMAPLTV